MFKRLSKTRYMSGLQCEKRLWLEINDRAKATPPTMAQQKIFDQGTEVGLLAQSYFPGGILIQINPSKLDQGVKETRQALDTGHKIVFEAAFFFDFVYVISDVITKNEDGSWTLIEVKSSTKVHREHIHDLALQKYVLEKSGLTITQVGVMHINVRNRFPDQTDLFETEDVTGRVEAVIPVVPKNLAKFKLLVQREAEPEIQIGPQCTSPYLCPFKDYCWQDFGDLTVFNIPRLSTSIKNELREQNIITLDQIPADHPLSTDEWAYVNRRLKKEIQIDRNAISVELAKLQYPLYFFDFETDATAIPKFDGVRPYQQVPFQYSCHVQYADGRLAHFDYLHTDSTDPRAKLVESMVRGIGQSGSLIAYYAPFEKDVILSLATQFPEYAAQLNDMADRLWDQLDIFRKYYKHYAFGSSNSIKNVLPVLVPKLSYADLNVSKGDQAQSVWGAMIRETDEAAKSKMIADLKAYCRLDTLAMVKIHQVLRDQVSELK